MIMLILNFRCTSLKFAKFYWRYWFISKL